MQQYQVMWSQQTDLQTHHHVPLHQVSLLIEERIVCENNFWIMGFGLKRRNVVDF